MDENISKSLNKTDDLEIKLKSWTENAESNLSMYATLSALQVYTRYLALQVYTRYLLEDTIGIYSVYFCNFLVS